MFRDYQIASSKTSTVSIASCGFAAGFCPVLAALRGMDAVSVTLLSNYADYKSRKTNWRLGKDHPGTEVEL
jgi:hypothetical protein